MTNRLTKKEQLAQEAFVKKLQIRKRKTKQPFIVAVLGLVGSGKSSVAKEIAKYIGAVVVNADNIRIELRKQKERYEATDAIAENVVFEILKQGGDIVIDSDFSNAKKRKNLLQKAKINKISVVFVRTICNFDVMMGRILTAVYKNKKDDFFGGASSKWQGNEHKGAVVKIREMWRRTPHHYKWINQDGGKWILKKFQFPILAEIDTTDEKMWPKQIKKLSEKLLK
jgi:predicted kinase